MEGSRQAGVPASAGPFSSSTGYQQQQQQQQQLPLKFSGNVSEANNGARSGGSGASQPKPIRRRMRMITSCLECRRRKLKCDKSQPCGHCLKNSRECLYLNPRLDEASQLRLTRFKDKVGSLEKQLEHNVVSSAASAGAGLGGRSGPLLADEVAHRDEDEDVSLGLEPADLANVDLAYEDDADGGADDLVDLGVLVGKMRITERVGGLARPRLIEEVSGRYTRPLMSQHCLCTITHTLQNPWPDTVVYPY